MDRTLYNDGVLVSQVDLERTETTKKFHINKRNEDASVYGVTSGQVTVNTLNNTLIDVSAFSGYVPNGEYIEGLVATLALQLADYTNGAISYVLAMYCETNTLLKPHETNGNSYPTAANRSYRIVILTQTQYNALVDSDDNLNNNTKDRALILAKVTAQGVGVALVSSNIVNPTIFGSAISAVKTANITGVQIYNVDRTTLAGVGTLSYAAGSQQITWVSPDPLDTVGAAVTIATSGLYEIKSGTLLKSLFIIVTSPSLPIGGTTTDTVTITNIYTQSVSRYTAEDIHHRSLIGSGVPTTLNPHGLTIEDLGVSSGIVEIHQDLFHSNGVLRTSASNIFELTVNTTGVDSLNVIAPIAGDTFYLNGREHNLLASSNIQFGPSLIQNHAVYDIYVLEGTNRTATLEKKLRAVYGTVPSAPPTIATYAQLRNVDRRLAITSNVTAIVRYDNVNDVYQFDSSNGGGWGIGIARPAVDGALRLFDINDQYFIDLWVSSVVPPAGYNSIVTISSITSGSTLNSFMEPRIWVGSILYSGSANDALGNGFGLTPLNSPNKPYLYRRIFGITGPDDIRDDGGTFADTLDRIPEASPALFTLKKVGFGERYPTAMVEILGGSDVLGNNGGQLRLRHTGNPLGTTWNIYNDTYNNKLMFSRQINPRSPEFDVFVLTDTGATITGNSVYPNNTSILFVKNRGWPASPTTKGLFITVESDTHITNADNYFGNGTSGNQALSFGGQTKITFDVGPTFVGELLTEGAAFLCSTGSTFSFGVRGRNTSSGYGVIAESLATNPIRSALRIQPATPEPTLPQMGDMHVSSVNGKPEMWDGNTWNQFVMQVFRISAATFRTGVGSFSPAIYTFGANTLRVGSTIRIKMYGYIYTNTVSPGSCVLEICIGGTGVSNTVAYIQIFTGALSLLASTPFCVEVLATITTIGVTGSATIGINGIVTNSTGDLIVSHIIAVSPCTINTTGTGTRTIQPYLRTFDISGTCYIDGFMIDIQGW